MGSADDGNDRELAAGLGPDVSATGFYEESVDGEAKSVAYVVVRGTVVAAASNAGRDDARARLRAKVERRRDSIRSLTALDAVEEMNLVVARDDPSLSPLRRFVRRMTLDRARLELELGVDGALVFVDNGSGRPSILARTEGGGTQLLRLGDPVHGDGGERPLPVPGRTPPPIEEARLRLDKAARIRTLLRCPRCRGVLDDVASGLACAGCARTYPTFEGRPVLALRPGFDPAPESKSRSANTYGQQCLALIEEHRRGWVLDCGSGCPSAPFYNVVHLELAAYPHVDVVTDGGALPFADATFDAVLSEAVLEHVEDPAQYLREIARVLKPEGEVVLDAAFLQPFHDYPDHFFNMTCSGLRLLVERAGLEVLSLAPGPHHQPWIALSLLLNGFVRGTPAGASLEAMLDMRLDDVIQRFEKGVAAPFDSLTPAAVERLAAGFSCLARKRGAPTDSKSGD